VALGAWCLAALNIPIISSESMLCGLAVSVSFRNSSVTTSSKYHLYCLSMTAVVAERQADIILTKESLTDGNSRSLANVESHLSRVSPKKISITSEDTDWILLSFFEG